MTLPPLPPGWHWSTVEKVGRLQLGRQRSPQYHQGENMKSYLRVANVFEDRIDTTDVMEMHFEPDEFERFKLFDGDVLLNEGQTPELLGRPAIYRGLPAECAFTNSLIRFQAGPDVLPEWALLVFRAHMRSGRFTRESRITTNIAHLSLGRLKGIEFPVAPLEEQRRIVAELGGLQERCAEMQKGFARARSMIVGARERVIRELLVPPGFPDSVPLGWRLTTVGELAEVAGGVTKDAKLQHANGLVEVPYLRVANVQNGRLDLQEIKRIRVTPVKAVALRLEPGDVLMNEGGDRDKLGRGWVWSGEIPDCIHQNHVFRARIRDEQLEPRLLSWHANTWGRAWFEVNGRQTTNLASISMSTLKRLPVPVPPPEAQFELAERIEGAIALLELLKAGVEGAARRLEALWRSRLLRAMASSPRGDVDE